MPSYEYNCRNCGKDFMVLLSVKELEKSPAISCEHCKSGDVVKKLTGFYTKTSKKS